MDRAAGYPSIMILRDLGVTSDKRPNDALDLVQSKMRPDGRWLVDTYRSKGQTKRAKVRFDSRKKENGVSG